MTNRARFEGAAPQLVSADSLTKENFMQSIAPQVASVSILEAITSRHSVRQYAPTPIAPGVLTELLRLTSLAPSARNLQPWRFIVIQEPGLKAALRAASHDQAQVEQAPAVIAIIADMDSTLERLPEVVHSGLDAVTRERTIASLKDSFAGMTNRQKADWASAQCMIAMAYLTLAARGFGLDTVPMQGFDQTRARELLGLSGSQEVAVMLPIGYAAQPGFSSQRLTLGSITTYR